jgi:hypothetical protein
VAQELGEIGVIPAANTWCVFCSELSVLCSLSPDVTYTVLADTSPDVQLEQ